MNPSPLYDEVSFLQKLSVGEEAAFRSVFDHYRKKVYFVAWRFLQNEEEAEDVVQDIFTKVWVGREKLPDVENFNAYINTLTRNHLFNAIRKKANAETFIRDTLKSANSSHYSDTNSFELKTLLHKAIGALPPQQKRVLQLGKIDGLKHEEIAKEMSISKETVKKHMMEATRKVKEFVEHYSWLLLIATIR